MNRLFTVIDKNDNWFWKWYGSAEDYLDYLKFQNKYEFKKYSSGWFVFY